MWTSRTCRTYFQRTCRSNARAGDHFLIQPDKLARLTRTNSGVDVLEQYGVKEVLAVKLKTNLDSGISGDDNLSERRIKFGSNVEYPPRAARSLRTCIWEALHDFNRIVLVIAVVGSVVIGILEETKKLGWHDIFGVAIVAAIFILVTVISDYAQDDQFQHMIKEIKRNNIQSMEVIRAGHPVQVSICDIVVGDVIPLKSGDEVPADGIYIGAQSLAIDKSRITGESKIFHKDSTRPFLRSGWRVKDGSGTMLVFRWGRSVHERVLKGMQQQLTVNVVAVTINSMAAVYYLLIPLNAVQFLWVNIIIFGLGPLALATEPPGDHLMSRPPIDRGQPLIKYIPWMRLLLKVWYQIIALLVINFAAGNLLKIYTNHDHATKVKNTMIFNTFVVCQISIEFGARRTGILDSPRNWVTSNSVFLGIVGIILAIQFIIIEYLGKAFSVVRLNWEEWQFSLTLGIVELFFAMLLFIKHSAQRNHH